MDEHLGQLGDTNVVSERLNNPVIGSSTVLSVTIMFFRSYLSTA
jgi:hypothetical protein